MSETPKEKTSHISELSIFACTQLIENLEKSLRDLLQYELIRKTEYEDLSNRLESYARSSFYYKTKPFRSCPSFLQAHYNFMVILRKRLDANTFKQPTITEPNLYKLPLNNEEKQIRS